MRRGAVGARGVDVLFFDLGQEMGGFLFLRREGGIWEDFGRGLVGDGKEESGIGCGFRGKGGLGTFFLV